MPVESLRRAARRPEAFPLGRQQLAQHAVLGSELGGEPGPEPGRQGGTAPAGRDRDHHRPLTDDRGQGEGARRRVVGAVHPDPLGLAVLVHGPVDGRVVGGGDDQAVAGDIASPVGPLLPADALEGTDLAVDLCGDHVDPGAAGQQSLGLAGRDPPRPHHQTGLVVQDQVHRVLGRVDGHGIGSYLAV